MSYRAEPPPPGYKPILWAVNHCPAESNCPIWAGSANTCKFICRSVIPMLKETSNTYRNYFPKTFLHLSVFGCVDALRPSQWSCREIVSNFVGFLPNTRIS